MKVVYIQSIGGASGDMLLGAFLDLGVPLECIQSQLTGMDLFGYSLSAEQGTRCEVRGTKLTVALDDNRRRTPLDLLNSISESSLSSTIKSRAEKVLKALWQAEARVHGVPQETLELEELGTIDTLIDVVGVAACLDYLEIERVFASPLVLGSAEPPRRPGGYSNPAPATLELVAMAGAPVAADRPHYLGAGELTTPTGAAIITNLAEFNRPDLSVNKIGVGLGGKDPQGFPNVIRVWLGQVPDVPDLHRQTGIVLLETNLDDVTGEVLGYAQERLFALGALDVWTTPIQMKKERPGVILSVLVPERLEEAAAELVLRETPTLGVRTRPVERYVAERESVSMTMPLGHVSVKIKSLSGQRVGASPEYEDCRRIAVEKGIPFQEVYQQAVEEARRQFLV